MTFTGPDLDGSDASPASQRELRGQGNTPFAHAQARELTTCPPSGASKPVRREPVEAHTLFGGFADKATVDLCRDAHHEPA